MAKVMLSALKSRGGRVAPKETSTKKALTKKEYEQQPKVVEEPKHNKNKKISARKEQQQVEQYDVVGKVGSFKKSDTITIMAEISEYKDQIRLDLREYQVSDNYTGPTKRGINLETENFMELFRLMEKVKEKLDQAGLLQE